MKYVSKQCTRKACPKSPAIYAILAFVTLDLLRFTMNCDSWCNGALLENVFASFGVGAGSQLLAHRP